MRLVVALGGNALLRRAATSLAEMIDAGHQIVVTHGNGPLVGLLALQTAAGPKGGPFPLDIPGAEGEGMTGYAIERALGDLLPDGALLATLVTRIRVSPSDPAFLHPTKPIGSFYAGAAARRIEAERGWSFALDGKKWRRVVASPEPLEILEMRVISMLVEQGAAVICAGGGIPVIASGDGSLVGIEAVIDTDRASTLLARQFDADMLLLLTDVDAVYLDFGKPHARRIARVGAATLAADQFAGGSMGPKIEAATMFATATGRPAAIGRIEDAAAILRGDAGTTIEAGNLEMEIRQ
jgi:carbamate kinase